MLGRFSVTTYVIVLIYTVINFCYLNDALMVYQTSLMHVHSLSTDLRHCTFHERKT